MSAYERPELTPRAVQGPIGYPQLPVIADESAAAAHPRFLRAYYSSHEALSGVSAHVVSMTKLCNFVGWVFRRSGYGVSQILCGQLVALLHLLHKFLVERKPIERSVNSTTAH